MTVYLLAGGGTAGHVNPLLATADRLRERDPGATVLVLGTAEGLEARLVPERGYELLTIPRTPFPRRPNGDLLRFPGRWRATIGAARRHIRDRDVDVVVGFGGYASAPAYRAAQREGVPIAIHEANARPGLANRLGARMTPFIGVTFAATRLRNARVVGFPLRREVETLDRVAQRATGAREFGLDPAKPTLLVTGGSSGARRINDTVSATAARVLGAGWQVLHLSGGLRDVITDPGLDGYRIVDYTDRMDFAFAAADLAIPRAGSATVSELAAVGLPAVFIPYAVGNGEQALNAQDAVLAGGAVLVPDAAFSAEWVADELMPLLLDRARVAEMAARIASVGHRDGADRMVDLVLEARGLGAPVDSPLVIPPNFDLEVPQDLGPVHFIGIGGSGMTGIAHMMLDAGLTVTGSDRSDNKYLDKLRKRGVTITIGHDAANLPDDARSIVYTSALWPDNPEYLLAQERGLNLLHRSQALHWLSRDHRVVTIAGAHGKTTTTGMIVTILRELGVDPGFVNGGIVLSLGASSATGTDDLFVLEADESDGSFRIYDTGVALVTNIDTVHMDHYGSADGVIDAYAQFVQDSQADYVIAGEGANVDAALARVSGKRAVRFGEAEGMDMRVSDIVATDHVTFDLTYKGVTLRGRVNVPGRHSAINAAGAVAAVVELGYPLDTAIAALEAFGGTNRRFELMNVVRGVSCYDDYAHEPAEAAAAVAGAQTVVGDGRVIAIHQPHLYSRTQMFSQDFAKAYEENADFTIVIAVDGAREDPIDGVSGQLVVDGFQDKSKVKLVEDWTEAAEYMATLARDGDIVMTLSCGTVYQLHPYLKDALEGSAEPQRDLITEGVAGTV